MELKASKGGGCIEKKTAASDQSLKQHVLDAPLYAEAMSFVV